MSFILQPWQLLLVILAGWMNQLQQQIIEFQRKEIEVLKKRLGKRRIILNDDERRILAVKAKVLGRKVLEEIGCLFTPDTLLRWQREIQRLHEEGCRLKEELLRLTGKERITLSPEQRRQLWEKAKRIDPEVLKQISQIDLRDLQPPSANDPSGWSFLEGQERTAVPAGKPPSASATNRNRGKRRSISREKSP